MPNYTGFQLISELSNVLPLVRDRGSYLLGLARDLRKSGSDIVVEEDLASILGRVRISAELEASFREKVVVQRFTPLHHGCPIQLQAGAGPTLLNAIKNRNYMATMIQLSLLGWTNRREQLANIIATAIQRRFDRGVAGANLDPGYEGILETLHACSSQSAAFEWTKYVDEVERKLRASIPTYQNSPDYFAVTPSVMLGALDLFYIVQSLPQDRKIVVTNEVGSITLLIWAHYVLGLDAMVVGGADHAMDTVIFGSSLQPHLTIYWTRANSPDAGTLQYPEHHYSIHRNTEMTLMDASMTIHIKCIPDANELFGPFGEERQALQGWGTAFLNRVINTSLLVDRNDLCFPRTANLVTALAIRISESTWRQRNDGSIIPSELKRWRVLESAELIFAGIPLSRSQVNEDIQYYEHNPLDERDLPNTFDRLFKRASKTNGQKSPRSRYLRNIQWLGMVVWLFSHIDNVQRLGRMPLLLGNVRSNTILDAVKELCKSLDHRILLSAATVFNEIAAFLCDNPKDIGIGKDREKDDQFGPFLYSDFGWSVYYNTSSDQDPINWDPEILRAAEGVPTNASTGERKRTLRDGIRTALSTYPEVWLLDYGAIYLPRCAASVALRKEYWSARSRAFQLSIFYNVQPSTEWHDRAIHEMHDFPQNIEMFSGPRQLHGNRWQTEVTPQDICEHPYQEIVDRAVRLGPDAATLLGFENWFEDSPEQPLAHKVLIYLTRDDARLRAIAISEFACVPDASHEPRWLMLRHPNCCDQCALSYTAGQPGRWILVL